MIACNCIGGARLGRCCMEVSQPSLPMPVIHYYPPNPIVYHPLNTPDGQRIEDLEEKIKQLQKELESLKKKD